MPHCSTQGDADAIIRSYANLLGGPQVEPVIGVPTRVSEVCRRSSLRADAITCACRSCVAETVSLLRDGRCIHAELIKQVCVYGVFGGASLSVPKVGLNIDIHRGLIEDLS